MPVELSESCEVCDAEIEIPVDDDDSVQPDQEIKCQNCGQLYILEVPDDEEDQPYLMRVLPDAEIAIERARDTIRTIVSVLTTNKAGAWMRDYLMSPLRRARDTKNLPSGHRFALGYVFDAIAHTKASEIDEPKTGAIVQSLNSVLTDDVFKFPDLIKLRSQLETVGFELMPLPESDS